ncbi:MAG: Lipid A export ATP-binding/permease protein MsbA [uncultured Thiotrichaceae bacterium]|uniref:Lipid A export ATP-binding/permease protein MsbA n=1 Tax=uncultured Thiotrichaceae bacterium TaxID=298394 RepID=A0A6S6U7Y7_9GAMM|nr:MAG: Lipid A export ATP-binding/permease protein MsbA [uncultured Thiotrichaceae bacterium]
MNDSIVNSKNLYLRLLRQLKPYRALFIVGILATVLLAITQPAIAAMMKPLLDGAFVEKNEDYIFWMPIVLLLLFSVRGLTSFVSTIAFAWVSSKVVMDLRLTMFDRVITQKTTFFDNNAVGRIISKFTNDVSQVTASATTVLVTLVRDSVQVIGLIAWMFYLDWKLSLILFAFVPVIAAVVYFIGKRLRVASNKSQESFGNMNHVLGEAIRGHKEVKMFGGQDYERQRMKEVANWVRRYQMKFQTASSLSVPIVEMISAFVMAYIIYLSTNRIEAEQMSVGTFMSFFGALGLLLAPIKRLTKVNEPLQRSLAAAESVFGLIDTVGEKEQKAANQDVLLKGNIEFDNVLFQYDEAEVHAINKLSLNIEANQTIALVGSSGSGKTTMANLLPRLYEINEGEIRIDGINIADLSLADLRRNIALVSQDVTLFNGTLANNIAYGEDGIDDARVNAAIESANAKIFIDEMPHGLNTDIGEDGVKLSGGQRQRIAIARALYKDAPILILDEATSALDNESEKLVQAALENLKLNRTTIIIAHRLSTIENADKIIVMAKGEIVEAGTHTELLENDGQYANLYQNQFNN